MSRDLLIASCVPANPTLAMPLKVAALYQFVSLPDFCELCVLCGSLAIKGRSFSRDGINGIVRGMAASAHEMTVAFHRT